MDIARAQMNPLCSCQSLIAFLIVGRSKLDLCGIKLPLCGMAFLVFSIFVFIIFVSISLMFASFRLS